MDKTSLGDRMKGYENVARNVLTRRTPVVLRVDGRAFRTFTRYMVRPFDTTLHYAMVEAAAALVNEIQGAKLAYGQSDEISVLITDYDTLKTDAWFSYNIQKMVSIAASVATIAFNQSILSDNQRQAQFDARVFNLPREEVANYFVWRQKDAMRNSVNMLAQAHFSHKQLQGKSIADIKEMLLQNSTDGSLQTIGQLWEQASIIQQRGFCVTPDAEIDRNVPIFTEDRDYIEKFVYLTD